MRNRLRVALLQYIYYIMYLPPLLLQAVWIPTDMASIYDPVSHHNYCHCLSYHHPSCHIKTVIEHNNVVVRNIFIASNWIY